MKGVLVIFGDGRELEFPNATGWCVGPSSIEVFSDTATVASLQAACVMAVLYSQELAKEGV